MNPRWPQDGPKMTPRCPQDAPRWPQVAPKRPQDGLKWTHNPLKTLGKINILFNAANMQPPRSQIKKGSSQQGPNPAGKLQRTQIQQEPNHKGPKSRRDPAIKAHIQQGSSHQGPKSSRDPATQNPNPAGVKPQRTQIQQGPSP